LTFGLRPKFSERFWVHYHSCITYFQFNMHTFFCNIHDINQLSYNIIYYTTAEQFSKNSVWCRKTQFYSKTFYFIFELGQPSKYIEMHELLSPMVITYKVLFNNIYWKYFKWMSNSNIIVQYRYTLNQPTILSKK